MSKIDTSKLLRKKLDDMTEEEQEALADRYRAKSRERSKRFYGKKLGRRETQRVKLNQRISGGITHSLKSGKEGAKWEQLVGYSLGQLKKHLENQFKPGMSWENYGDWHIDHVIPKSVFNFWNPEHDDFKRCWALKNLQPLWGEENRVKYSKLKTHFQPTLAFDRS